MNKLQYHKAIRELMTDDNWLKIAKQLNECDTLGDYEKLYNKILERKE